MSTQARPADGAGRPPRLWWLAPGVAFVALASAAFLTASYRPISVVLSDLCADLPGIVDAPSVLSQLAFALALACMPFLGGWAVSRLGHRRRMVKAWVGAIALALFLGLLAYPWVRGAVLRRGALPRGGEWALLVEGRGAPGKQVRLRIEGEATVDELTLPPREGLFSHSSECRVKVPPRTQLDLVAALDGAAFFRLPRVLEWEPGMAHDWWRVSVTRGDFRWAVVGLRHGGRESVRMRQLVDAVTRTLQLPHEEWPHCCALGYDPREPCS